MMVHSAFSVCGPNSSSARLMRFRFDGMPSSLPVAVLTLRRVFEKEIDEQSIHTTIFTMKTSRENAVDK